MVKDTVEEEGLDKSFEASNRMKLVRLTSMSLLLQKKLQLLFSPKKEFVSINSQD